MKTTFYKPIMFSLLAAGILSSCINDDDYGIVNNDCVETTLTANLEVEDVPAGGDIQQITEDYIIEAYVTSSDRSGNFFKSISFQTLDGSEGFSVPVDVTSTFINFEPGRKVFIRLNGLYTDTRNGVRIGDVFIDGGEAQVGRMPLAKYRNALQRSCQGVNEDELVRTLTIPQALSDANLNTLIEIENVQFDDAAMTTTYYDAGNDLGGATNHNLVDAQGNTIIFRTSSFADFAPKNVPDGNGTVRGVVTKFGSTYQFIARYESDVMLDGERVEIDLAAPIVGNAIAFNGTYNETFESYALNNRNFPNAINDPSVGSRYWEVKQFPTGTGNKYIQMTSFGGTPEANRTLFIVPVDMTAASTFRFESKAGFANGNVLKVYYTTDYTAGSNINNATLTDITSSFTISPGQASGYPTNFTPSGTYNIPASLTGNGFFVFEYTGNGGGITTTMQIDNIVVN